MQLCFPCSSNEFPHFIHWPSRVSFACIAMCAFNNFIRENDFPHVSQTLQLCFLCTSNDVPQLPHSPTTFVCFSMCDFILCFEAKSFSQTVHLNCFCLVGEPLLRTTQADLATLQT